MIASSVYVDCVSLGSKQEVGHLARHNERDKIINCLNPL